MGILGSIIDGFMDGVSGRYDERKKQEAWSAFISAYSVTCRRCNALAEPIGDTKNRYRCQCGNQFAGAHHGGFTYKSR